jgi:hypothetical protein
MLAVLFLNGKKPKLFSLQSLYWLKTAIITFLWPSKNDDLRNVTWTRKINSIKTSIILYELNDNNSNLQNSVPITSAFLAIVLQIYEFLSKLDFTIKIS